MSRGKIKPEKLSYLVKSGTITTRPLEKILF